MRLFFLFAIFFILNAMPLSAQSYDNLWKQVGEAQNKDLPKTAIEVLDKIIVKATNEKEYGHLLKAQLSKAKEVTSITPDSLQPEVQRLVKEEEGFRSSNPVLAAVLQSVLGGIYEENSTLGEDHMEKSKAYYLKSLSNPEMLADAKVGSIVPLTVVRTDSKFFNNDLLHVLCFQARNYSLMHDFYEKAGCREAACLAACFGLKERELTRADAKAATSPMVKEIDSLMQVYADLDVSGELALCKYRILKGAEDVKPGQLVDFIDMAQKRWANWKRIQELQNERNNLVQPMFSVDLGCQMLLPDKERVVKLENLRNINALSMNLARVNLDVSERSYYLYENRDFDLVRKAIVKGTERKVSCTFQGHKEYELFNDSIVLGPLQKGVYLVEFSADNISEVARTLIYVSDIYALRQSLPGDKTRFVVVNATTGKPISKAKIRFTNDNEEKEEVVKTCDDKGELVYDGNLVRCKVFAYTEDDKYCPYQDLWEQNFRYYPVDKEKKTTQIFTDRAIYRPGQEVHLALVRFANYNGIENKVLEGERLDVTLRDANYKEVATKTVTTDEWGKANLTFTLPNNGLTGRFTIQTRNGSTSIRVEEYKRPTFQVEMEEVKQSYKDGDTIIVYGKANTFSGVPVQGAKVKYSVVRRTASWWWSMSADENLVEDAEAICDEKGSFSMEVPMVLPDKPEGQLFGRYASRYYNITVEAVVTDQAGESHQASISLPLSDKPTAFDFSIQNRILKDSIPPVTFTLRNMAGNLIDGDVEFFIDDSKAFQAKANEPVALPLKGKMLDSGKHVIKAICMGDTVTHDFVLFSLEDKKPCVETHDWFYATARQFSNDDKPVVVQVGSSDPHTYVLYSVISENRILEQGHFILNNANQTRKWYYKEEYGTGVVITFTWVRDGVQYKHTHEIQRPMPDKRILLAWETFRDRLQPGTQEEWTLKATYPDGSPADAQLIATLFDHSLDEIASHSWWMRNMMGVNLPYVEWKSRDIASVGLYKNQYLKGVYVEPLRISSFDSDLFMLWQPRFFMHRAYSNRMLKSANVAADEEMLLDAMPMPMEEAKASGNAEMKMEEASSDDGDLSKSDELDNVSVRENLDETAFFMPAVSTDADGRMSLKFTLPEAVTTWRFMGLATDRKVNYGTIEGNAVAQKDIMVVPNVPRFVRLGDKAQIVARIFNTTDNSISGKARMQLVDPETEQVVASQEKDFSFDAKQTTNVVFDYMPSDKTGVLICKIVASGNGFSDGEQHYLPVLPRTELITKTLPFTQNSPKTTIINLDKLFPNGVEDAKLTVEYTNNPAWMMIQALPTMAVGDSDNAITQAMSYYANALGQYIMNLSPIIKQTVMKWRDEQGALESNLAKNEELKDLLLNETPWVGEADKEESQKRSLVKFFDEETLNIRLNSALEKIKGLQLGNGAWCWWKGMEGSPYMTTAVIEMFIRLNKMIGPQKDTKEMLDKAFGFLDKYLKEEEAELRKLEKKGYKVRPSETAIDILYNYAVDGRKPSSSMSKTVNYMIALFEKKTTEFTIYGKARAAVILSHFGKVAKAKEFMRSVEEYSVATEDMGRYYDTRKAYYSWFSYNIPTEVAVMEAYKKLTPEKTVELDEMRIWLLQQKRAQIWNTPINSVDAVYAFLDGNMGSLEKQEETKLTVDDEVIETSKATAGLGYVKGAMKAQGKKQFAAQKTSTGTSWGALYAQFYQDVAQVEASSADLSVKREVLSNNGEVKVGDKVIVRITIKAERNLDFVEVIDRRPACLEPVEQVSRYQYGYYVSPKDYSTNYYFNKLPKGTHVLETEYYIDRKGEYISGTCKVQCAYAPEFSATGNAIKVKVNE